MNKKDIIGKLKGKTLSDTQDCNFISTGCYALNRIITGRYHEGLPIGRIVQLQGDSSTGKTLFATTFISAAQKAGCFTKLLDTENTFSKAFGAQLGIDVETLMYDTPSNLEDTFDNAKETIDNIREFDTETPIVIVVDSVAVLPTKEEGERDNVGDASPMDGAIRAKAFGSLLRRINHHLSRKKATLVLINQIRNKVGVIYGSPDTIASGGRALEFYLSVDLQTISNKTSDVIKGDNKVPVGIQGRVKCRKNKVGIPFQECDFEVLFDRGLNPFYGLAPMLVEDGYLDRSAAGRLSVGEIKFKKDDFDKILLDYSIKDPALEKVRELLDLKQEEL